MAFSRPRRDATISVPFVIAIVAACSMSDLALSDAGEVRWSPDGNWIAFRQDTDPESVDRLKPGWLVSPDRFTAAIAPASDHRKSSSVLWIGKADLMLWYTVDRSSVFVSEPAWRPDGSGLFFARIARNADGVLEWTLVELYGISRSGLQSRIAYRRELPKDWKPNDLNDRTSVVLSQLHAGPAGLVVLGDPLTGEPVLLDTVSQEIRARFPDGYNARIGTGSDVVAWLRSEDWPPRTADLVVTTLADGQNRLIRNVLPNAPALFGADGRTFYVGKHEKPPEGLSVPAGSDWPVIVKVDLKDFKPARYSRPISTPVTPKERLIELSFALDAEEEMLLCAPSIRPRPAEISWFLPSKASTQKRFPPLDVVTNATELSLSIDQKLAFRLGNSQFPMNAFGLPAALCDPRSEVLQPLAPDADATRNWVEFLAMTTLRNLKDQTESDQPPSVDRPKMRFSFVPTLAEMVPESPSSTRLRRIGAVGLRALGFDPKNVDARRIERLDDERLESAVLFFALTHHYAEATKALEILSKTGLDETQRSRMIALKAQFHIARGQTEEARLTLDALSSCETKELGRLSPDGRGGWALTPIPPTQWSEFLKKLTETTVSSPRSEDGLTPHNPFGHANPDDPENDPDLIFRQPVPVAP
jgi:hypothetical protein